MLIGLIKSSSNRIFERKERVEPFMSIKEPGVYIHGFNGDEL